MGYNPHRRYRARAIDYVLLIVVFAIAIALVVWAFAG